MRVVARRPGYGAGLFWRYEPLYRLRDWAGTAQVGTNLLGLHRLHRAAKRAGMETRGLEADIEGLCQLTPPAILHWEHNHYVVLVRLTPKRAQLADPARGLVWVTLDELQRRWTGRLLILRPGTRFQRGNFTGLRGERGLLSHLVHLRGSVSVLMQLIFATVALSLLALGAPLLSQALFDRVLTFREENLLPMLLAGIFALVLFQTLLASLRAHVATGLSMRLRHQLSLSYLDHLLRLPAARLDTRLPGDLLSRFGDLAQIERTLRNLVVNLPPAVLTLLLSFGLLFTYNPRLALVALLILPVHLLYLGLLVPRLRENNRQRLAKGAQVNSSVLGNLEGFATLKALRGENWALSRGREQVSGFNDLIWKGFLLSNWGGAAIGLLASALSLFLLWYGAGRCWPKASPWGSLWRPMAWCITRWGHWGP